MELTLNERKLHGASCRHAPQLGCLLARIGNQEACSTKPFCLSDAWTIPLITAQGQPAIGPLQKRPDGFGLEIGICRINGVAGQLGMTCVVVVRYVAPPCGFQGQRIWGRSLARLREQAS